MICSSCKLWKEETFPYGYLKFGKCPLIKSNKKKYPKYQIFTLHKYICPFTWIKRVIFVRKQ